MRHDHNYHIARHKSVETLSLVPCFLRSARLSCARELHSALTLNMPVTRARSALSGDEDRRTHSSGSKMPILDASAVVVRQTCSTLAILCFGKPWILRMKHQHHTLRHKRVDSRWMGGGGGGAVAGRWGGVRTG